jgi:aryl-alcohol dehydrogenase-like predicted oxidoreductase
MRMNGTGLSRRALLAASGAWLTAIAASSRAADTGAAGGTTGAGPRETPRTGPGSPAASADASGELTIGGDLKVNRLGFGAMRVTGDGIWGAPSDPAEARRVLQRAVELGVDFIDTADAYGPGTSEELIAAALHPYPPGLVIATKGGIVRPSRDAWDADGRPQHLREACEASLRRLKLERIDLYQLHTIDPAVPMEDSVGELVKLQQEGKIRHIGVSNFSSEELDRALRIAQVASVQNRYNVADRSSDAVLRICESHRIAFIPWRPLAQGASDAAADGPVARLAKVAERRGLSMPQAAIAWSLARSPVMLPIPGTSKVRHLEENVLAASVRLTPDEMKEVG